MLARFFFLVWLLKGFPRHATERLEKSKDVSYLCKKPPAWLKKKKTKKTTFTSLFCFFCYKKRSKQKIKSANKISSQGNPRRPVSPQSDAQPDMKCSASCKQSCTRGLCASATELRRFALPSKSARVDCPVVANNLSDFFFFLPNAAQTIKGWKWALVNSRTVYVRPFLCTCSHFY